MRKQIKSERLELRLTKADKNRLKAAAKSADTSINEFVVSAALDRYFASNQALVAK